MVELHKTFCFKCHDKYTGVFLWQLYLVTNEAVYTVERTTVFRLYTV